MIQKEIINDLRLLCDSLNQYNRKNKKLAIRIRELEDTDREQQTLLSEASGKSGNEKETGNRGMTNGDRLRAMSSAELVKWLDITHCRPDLPDCPEHADCRKCWLEWLDHPAKEN